MATIVQNGATPTQNHNKKSGKGWLPVAIVIVLLTLFLGFYALSGVKQAIVPALLCAAAAILCFVFYRIRSGNKRPGSIAIAGEQSENAATAVLARLPEEYTVLRNTTVHFGDGKSEIDNIIIGPAGVFIVETKGQKGTITADYDAKEWSRIKTDKYGIEHPDTFYSPVKQVGTHTYRLANFLRDNKIFTHVQAIVYFSHPEAEVHLHGEGETPVFTYGEQDKMLDFIADRVPALSAKQVLSISALLIAKND